MLFIFSSLCSSYSPSRFTSPGTNRVMTQEADSFEVLGEVPKPENIKNILDSKFSEGKIKDENRYAWLGHPFTGDPDDFKKEAWNAKVYYCKASTTLTQDKLYYHPAGLKQFTTNQKFIEEIKNATRIKLRMFYNTRIWGPHWTSLYAMPGELITFEIPQMLVNKVRIYVNRHVDDYDDPKRYNKRYHLMKCNFVPTTTKFSFGWPLGGPIDVQVNWNLANEGVELNISGGIRMPYYLYGSTTDQEWEDEIRHYKAPLAIIDSGHTYSTVSAERARNHIRVGDACAMWRTISRIFHSINDVTGHAPRSGEIRWRSQLLCNYDSFVAAGAAYALPGHSLIHCPTGWGDAMSNYDGAKWGMWGNVHEYGHNYQNGWGWGQTGEVTNNVPNTITYALCTPIDTSRQINLNGDFLFKGGGWNWVCHEYEILKRDGIFCWYANPIFFFGHHMWRECMHEHIKQISFKRSEYGYYGELALHMAKWYKRDMRPYLKSSHWSSWISNILPNMFNEKCNQKFDEMHLPEYHPCVSVYSTGYVVDGREFENHNPFEIPARSPFIFEFQKVRTFQDLHKFRFVNVTGGAGNLTMLSENGRVKYIPVNDTSYIDKFYVNYEDTTNHDITTMFVKVKQVFRGVRNTFMKLPKPADYYKTTMMAYEDFLANNDTIETATVRIVDANLRIAKYSSNQRYLPWIAVADGVIIPKYSGSFKFYIRHDEDAIFYLTERNLAYNTTLDEPFKRADLKGRSGSNSDSHATTYISLKAGHKYNYRLVLINKGGDGEAIVDIKVNGSGNIFGIPNDWLYLPGCDNTDVDLNPFVPKFEEEIHFGIYYDSMSIPIQKDKFTLVKNPSINPNLGKYLFDSSKQKQDTVVTAKQFPIEYVVDFGEKIFFDRLHIPFRSDKAMESDLDFACDGKTFLTSYKLHSSSSDIWFEHLQHCKNLSIKVMNNKYGIHSSFVEIDPQLMRFVDSKNIVPATHEGFKVNDEAKCKLSRHGLYYNGKGWHLQEGCELSITVELNETGTSIGILGDRSIDNGIMEVYLDNEFAGSVHTDWYVKEQYYSNHWTMYQQPLWGYRNLTPNKNYTIKIVAKSGKLGIAGLIANTNSTFPPPPVVSRYDMEFNEDGLEANDYDPDGDDTNITLPDADIPIPTDSIQPTAGSNLYEQNSGTHRERHKPTEKDIVPFVIVALTCAAVLAAAVAIIYLKTKESSKDEADDGEETNYNIDITNDEHFV